MRIRANKVTENDPKTRTELIGRGKVNGGNK